MELHDLVEEIDIVEYISQFVELEEKNGEYWGLSPFTDEKTPSFSVRREGKNFYDFSSGVGGNIYTFVRYYNDCSSRDAVKILQSYAGLEGKAIKPANKLVATQICKKYKKPAATHKKHSKITVYPADQMLRYEKNEKMLAVWESEGISKEALDKFQVYYDAFSNRLVYPIYDLNGDIVNIGGRTLDPLWKEKGFRKYTYFSGWGVMAVVYGLYENMESILKKKEIIIFEGCKSVLIAHSWGIYNTGALLTSHLNPEQMKLLARLGVSVIFALDKEIDITKDHNIQKLKQYVRVGYFYDEENLLEPKDAPVDEGQEVFNKLYENKKIFR